MSGRTPHRGPRSGARQAIAWATRPGAVDDAVAVADHALAVGGATGLPGST